ncbi:hypothetical protein NYR97_07075 [Xanthomonas hydrangeae]|uniref:Uncharacterized protein n=1 Tax=Xanthomonas hydrangeae TaxID=2775159 RepID=A0AAU0BDN0_9XANT|nr:hypothetical protein [Xanthomonas hydrangeae]WOB51128.1 hypothetical protein NYR97_07075 [Xanthomonas hydrangeae]
MSKLLIYIGEDRKFDFKKTVADISGIEGVSNQRVGEFIGAVFECDYVWNSQSTIVRISPELETITVEGIEDCALKFAIELQKKTNFELHVIDMDYSFNLSLMSFETISDFRTGIES